MVYRPLLVAVCLTAFAITTPAAQSDLDDLMSRVLARRDENWKKLQQYTLNERETLQLTALAVFRIFGRDREYVWFPRAGFFIRSPLKADGVTLSEEARRRAEDRWLRNAQRQEQRRAARARENADTEIADEPAHLPGDVPMASDVDDIVLQSFEPDFIQSANFLRFKFDQGQYALVGRERMLDRDVLKIEYYPKILFRDDDREDRRDREDRPDRTERPRDKEEEFEEDFEEKMNKVSLVTLWVDPAERQILRYEFRNIEMDFLPAQWLVRLDGMRATMQMAEPFPNVWLPASLSVRFRLTLAAGPVEAKLEKKYTDYRLPTTSGRVVQ